MESQKLNNGYVFSKAHLAEEEQALASRSLAKKTPEGELWNTTVMD